MDCAPHRRLADGSVLGKLIAIEPMERYLLNHVANTWTPRGSNSASMAVCSPPLHKYTEWLEEWVQHNFLLGADVIYLHVPSVRTLDSALRQLLSLLHSMLKNCALTAGWAQT